MKIKLTKVRLSFPHLNAAASFEGSKPKFSAGYLMEPNSPNVKAIKDAIETVAKEKWGAKADATLKAIRAADKTCLRDGNTKADKDGYEGMMFLNASSEKRPKVVDADGVTELEEADGRPYGGCYVNAFVEIWAMDNKFGKRVCASLGGVQFVKHGEPFGAGGGADDEFDSVEDEEESLT